MQHVSSSTEKQRKLAALTGMALNYGKELPPELGKMWLRLLDKHSADVVESAVTIVITEYEYKTLPPFAVLAKAIDKVSGVPEKDAAIGTSAENEWKVLMDLIDSVGSYGSPELHPITERVVRMLGGWRTVCLWEKKDMQFHMGRFLEFWKNSAQNEPLLGLETQNILDMINHKRGKQNALESNLERLGAMACI